MGELADVLELLHLAVTRVHSLTATLVEWYDEERMARAVESYDERGRPAGFVGILRDGDCEPRHNQYELRTLVHLSAPDRYRLVKQANDYVHRPQDLLVVSDGAREWTYRAAKQEAHVQRRNRHEIFDMLDPAWLSGGWTLSVVRRSTYEDRTAVELAATPRQSQLAWRGGMAGQLADRLAAVIDAETGLLLSIASDFEGAPWHIKRLVDVSINPRLDDDLFVFTPPSGVAVHDLSASAERPTWRLGLRARYHVWRLRRRARRGRA